MTGTFCARCGDLHGPAPGSCRAPPLVNRTLPGDFRVREALGPTAFGTLYRGEHVGSGVQVTLLFVHSGSGSPELAADAPDLAQLRAQLAGAAAIRHPNVSVIRALGETAGGVCYFALEELQGKLLSEILKIRRVLPLAEATDLIVQAAAGLQAVHEAGLLHGNLSPDSILVTHTSDGRPLVKLVRFGVLAHGAEGPVGGDDRAGYAAPERLTGWPLDPRSDVFSLGAVLHRLLSGEPPGTGEAVVGQVPAAVRPLLLMALDPLPERRPQTASEFAQALSQAETAPDLARVEFAPATAPVTATDNGWRRGTARRSRTAVLVGLVSTLVLAGLWLGRAAEHPAPVNVLDDAATAAVTEGDAGAQESMSNPPSPADTTLEPTLPKPQQRTEARQPRRARPDGIAVVPQPVAAEAEERRASEPEVPESLAPDTAPRLPPRLEGPPPATAPAPLATAPPKVPQVTPEGLASKVVRRETAGAEARAAVSRAVASYASALESGDLRAVQWVYPDLSERERRAWEKFFKVARDLAVTLSIERLAITDSEARLDVRGTYRYWNRSLRRAEQTPVRFLATLRRGADGWRLTAIR